MSRHSKPRRGVLLLVVLSLLVLFGLIGITFIVVAGQYQRVATLVGQDEKTGDEPTVLTDATLHQLLRGSNLAGSVIGTHDLLGDIYGNDGFRGIVNNFSVLQLFDNTSQVSKWSDEQFVDVVVDAANLVDNNNLAVPFLAVPTTPNYFSGRVLTFTSGAARNVSTRIVRSFRGNLSGNSGGALILRVLRPRTKDGSLVTLSDIANAQVVVNGAAFNGTGFGLLFEDDDNDGMNGEPEDNDDIFQDEATLRYAFENFLGITSERAPVALLPNHAGRTSLQKQKLLIGGADESYDAPDYQNMLLAMAPPPPSPPMPYSSTNIIPSLHRPALINYWYHRIAASGALNDDPPNQWPFIFENPYTKKSDGSNAWKTQQQVLDAIVELKRRIILRPLVEDHPRFNGGNNNFFAYMDAVTPLPPNSLGPITPSWDVDNDGDGVNDSIWVDIGFPAQTTHDGRQYKPLMAVLCVDLDGRLNVNAHGRPEFVSAVAFTTPYLLAGGTTTSDLLLTQNIRGQGYGPPEISLDVLHSGTTPLQIFQQRYADTAMYPGHNGLDLLARVKFFEHPPLSYWTTTPYTPSSFSSPDDPHGILAMGLDHFGQPTYSVPPGSNGGVTLMQNTPYEHNLLNKSRHDASYRIDELERILRRYDVDALQLPDRLATTLSVMIDSTGTNPWNITTDSFDLPVPGALATNELRETAIPPTNTAFNPSRGSQTFVDLLLARLEDNGVTSQAQIDKVMRSLLSPDVAMGMRMDINRPLGNGRDDTGNNIVDEPDITNGEFGITNLLSEQLVSGSPEENAVTSQFSNATVNATNGAKDNSGNVTLNGSFSRHLFARHLYVVAMTLIDQETEIPDRDIARAVAQWCVNVVDFRDADSIMTAFEYDPNPFNGWSVNGIPDFTPSPGSDGIDGTHDDDSFATEDPAERDVVWGTERPELLITEALAFHDRRTEDRDDEEVTTESDEGGMGMGSMVNVDDPMADEDFDQRLRPRGSFFVELYNPWTSNENTQQQQKTNELYQTGGVHLNRNVSSPVWRLVVTEPTSPPLPDVEADNEEVDSDSGSAFPPDVDYFNKTDQPTILRRVYFTEPSTPTSRDFYPDGTLFTQAKILQPGRYAVVGSRGYQTPTGYVTNIGRHTAVSATETDPELIIQDTRQIVLDPANDLVTVLFNGHHADNTINELEIKEQPTPGVDVTNAVAIVVNRQGGGPGSMNISEPINGYDSLIPDDYTMTLFADGEYAPPVDTPLDQFNGANSQDSNPSPDPDQTSYSDVVDFSVNGTTVAFREVHLQRLANPLVLFDPQLNPYRTIDSMAVDLTVFNGLENDDADQTTTDGIVRFHSRQRGDDWWKTMQPANHYRALWPVEPYEIEPLTAADASIEETAATNPPFSQHHFPHMLRSTLGYLNQGYARNTAGSTAMFDSTNTPPQTPPGSIELNGKYLGAPDATLSEPFSWLAWNNRPFVSQYELMQVPASRSSLLLHWYSLPDATSESPYGENGGGTDHAHSEYGHLTNFYHSDDDSLNLFRILDYVHVPSRFIGTDTLLNPQRFSVNNDITAGFQTPFNRVSKYREPGRININTIYDPKVWNAIRGNLQGPSYTDLVESRRGFAPNNSDLLNVDPMSPFVPVSDPSIPTFFANPFRGFGNEHLVPLENLERSEIENTLLRSDTNVPSAGMPGDPPTKPNEPDNQGTIALFATQETNFSRSSRNSYFRYELLHKLGNTVTTRSNVYAIWITVGFFEVEPNFAPSGQPYFPDAAHPDGLRLAQELGLDTGTVKRHRAFYIVDRSIPVAYESGKDHNVSDMVLLRRLIE